MESGCYGRGIWGFPIYKYHGIIGFLVYTYEHAFSLGYSMLLTKGLVFSSKQVAVI
ncbi:MAG: hypothetical protein Q8N08_09410 [Methanobacteriaceae archaeon]|nr:hypothetical protein [Methanobacteriaceae archaeon]